MQVFYCTKFTGFYPIGKAAIIVAETKEQALTFLNTELNARGLPSTEIQFINTLEMIPHANILVDGEY